jgi:hypothetical protein
MPRPPTPSEWVIALLRESGPMSGKQLQRALKDKYGMGIPAASNVLHELIREGEVTLTRGLLFDVTRGVA